MKEDYELITADEIRQSPFSPYNWIIPGLLPEGLAILSGPPKAGKSFIALNIAWAVASGNPLFGHYHVNRGRVLYITYESNAACMQERLAKLPVSDDDDSPLADIFFLKDNIAHTNGIDFLGYYRLNDGGAKEIKEILSRHPDIALVIIDSIDSAFYPKHAQNSDSHSEAALYWTVLQRYAFQNDICLLFVRSSRASRRDEFYDLLVARADVSLWLESKVLPDKSITGKFTAHGRDIPRECLPLNFNPDASLWSIPDFKQRENLTRERKQIFDILETAKTAPMQVADIATALGKSQPNISKMLRKMERSGIISSAGFGKYKLSEMQ